MATQRTNAAEIKSFLTHLEFWLRFSARKWWPRFLFHFTDVNNLASILSCGKLYSRNLLRTSHPNFVDIASPGVIQNTSIEYQNYVRLYFRPRTPTQYRNEGIRPAKQRELNAHCSIPVFLLFDSYEILARNDSRFSNGNLGRSGEVVVDGSIEFLKSLPFEKIYHDGTIPDTQDKREITFHRNAEVLIPDELDLSALRFIVCRSEAEKETLINMLQEDTRLIWLTKIIYNPKQFFYGRWTFVERAYKTESSIKFYFSPDSIEIVSAQGSGVKYCLPR